MENTVGYIDEQNNKYLLEVLEKSRQKLLDTTKRNRLLNYRESSRDIAIVDEMADRVFNDLFFDNKKYYFDHFYSDDSQTKLPVIPIDDLNRALPSTVEGSENLDSKYTDNKLQTVLSEKELERRLKRLLQLQRSFLEERGANCLYLAIGFLEWEERYDSNKPLRSPLMLLPVHLRREGSTGNAKYSIIYDGDALETNYSLVEKLKHDFDFNLPMLDEEETPEKYWQKVEESIQNKKSDGWKVVNEMSLGIYQFHKLIMWQDLDPKNWPKDAPLVDKNVLKRLLLGPSEDEPAPGQITLEYPQDGDLVDIEQVKLPLIRNADSSQYSAILDALNHKNGIVIEGPPGTGKSQTITNIIAAAMDSGLSVLFVAEKMAALNVVFKRLEECGLGDFCLQLHGLKTNKKELLESVVQRTNVDVKLPSSLALKERKLEQAKESLIDYSRVMSKIVGPEKVPLYDVIWKIENLESLVPKNINAGDFAIDTKLSYETFISNSQHLDDATLGWENISADTRLGWSGFIPRSYSESLGGEFQMKTQSFRNACREIKDGLNTSIYLPKNDQLSLVRTLLDLATINHSSISFDLPLGVDEKVLFRVVQAESVDEYDACLNEIEKYLEQVKSINYAFDYSSEDSAEFANTLLSQSNLLANIVIDQNVTIGEVSSEIVKFQEVINALNSFDENAGYLISLRQQIVRTIGDYERLFEDAKFLFNGPEGISIYANANHINPSCLNQLESAKQINRSIYERSRNLDLFNLERISLNATEIKECGRCIDNNRNNIFSFLKSDYRHAKKTLSAILKNPKDFSKDDSFLKKVDMLYHFKNDSEKFASNEIFKHHLGIMFKGLETNWEALELIISYAQNLRSEIGLDKAKDVINDWDLHQNKLIVAKENNQRYLGVVQLFRENHPFSENLWHRPTKEIVETLSPWVGRLRHADQLLMQSWCNSNLTMQQANDYATAYFEIKAIEKEIENNSFTMETLAGNWLKAKTNIDNLYPIRDLIKSTLELSGMSISIFGWLLIGGSGPEQKLKKLLQTLEPLHDSWTSFATILKKYGELDESRFLDNAITLDSLETKLGLAETTIDNLTIMTRWSNSADVLNDIGLSSLSKKITNGLFSGAQASAFYQAAIYKNILEEQIQENKVLKQFSQASYQNTIDRFSKLDKEIMVLNAEKIASKLAKVRVPQGNSSGRVGTFSEMGLVRHEAKKKTRHVPIRQLIKRSGQALKTLKPCFLMSPLSVAQYLGRGNIHFDLVVMDEASQMRPEDALGAIARSSKAIIVGDPKQLPPTNFFRAAVKDSEDEDEATVIDDTESILDVCLKQFPYRRLRWHYRSEHESLIQFSNEQFYDDDLIVLPSSISESRDFGVHYNYITEPSYKSGKNRNEARVVVQNIVMHFQQNSGKSLGVAAFNKAQAEEIRMLLDKEKEKDPLLDKLINESNPDEPLFIKNLENVQGDERDVIFISTVYGPERAGMKVAQRFGPINSASGWRRLNVIATRAKQRVEIFSSLRPTDILANSKRGARALRNYLEYAATGDVTEFAINTGREPDSEFEVAVMKVIKDLGYECVPQVGVAGFFIDIGIVHPDRPGEYLLGVECDGATYHSSSSMRDRDRLRQEILEAKKWNIHRIWSTNWFHARSNEISRLDSAIKERLAAHNKDLDIEDNADKEITAVVPILDLSEDHQADDHAGVLLEEALERFWVQNIKPDFSDRKRSILSISMIELLVRFKPTNRDDWFNLIPRESRSKINQDEGEFRQDIFELIADFA